MNGPWRPPTAAPNAGVVDIDLQSAAGFGAFYLVERHRLEALAYGMTGNRETAEDVVANAAIRVWQRCQREVPEDPSAFIFRAVQNEARDQLRRRACRPSTEPLSPAHESAGELAVAAERQLDDRDELDRLLPTLPENQRQALEMRYLHGLTDGEIAARTGVAVATVRSRVHRGLQRLRREVRDTRPNRSEPATVSSTYAATCGLEYVTGARRAGH